MSYVYKKKPTTFLGGDRADVDRGFGIGGSSWNDSSSHNDHEHFRMKPPKKDDSLDSFFDHPTSIKAQRKNEERVRREEAQRRAKERAEQRQREQQLSQLRQQNDLPDKPWNPKDNMFNHPTSIVNREVAEREAQQPSSMPTMPSLDRQKTVTSSPAMSATPRAHAMSERAQARQKLGEQNPMAKLMAKNINQQMAKSRDISQYPQVASRATASGGCRIPVHRGVRVMIAAQVTRFPVCRNQN